MLAHDLAHQGCEIVRHRSNVLSGGQGCTGGELAQGRGQGQDDDLRMHLALLEELAQGGADGIRCRLDLLVGLLSCHIRSLPSSLSVASHPAQSTVWANCSSSSASCL